jgi:Zn-dependent peptidase ImmA (M78 family)
MPETLIDRVRQVIHSSGKTKTDFAEMVDLDGPKLAKSLSEQRRFSSYELAAIAQVGGVTVDWLLSGSARSLVFAHRAAQESVDEADEIGRQVIDLVDDRIGGLSFLGRPFDVPDLPRPVTTGLMIDQGKKTAQEYVSALGHSIRSLTTVGLIDRIEATFGINVIVADLPSHCDGLSYSRDGVRAIVIATTSVSPYRQRFTLAHELGHIAFGDAYGEVVEEKLYVRKDHEELRVNSFAANLLSPGGELRDVLGARTPSEIFDELVLDFQVSPESMAWRLHNEGLIDKAQLDNLRSLTAKSIAMRAGRAAEHVERVDQASQERPPVRLVAAYLDAYADGRTTLGPAASLLGWSLERAEATYGETSRADESDMYQREQP